MMVILFTAKTNCGSWSGIRGSAKRVKHVWCKFWNILCIYICKFNHVWWKTLKNVYLQPTIAAIEKTMAERDQEIQNIKEKMNNVEDDVFASFCEQIGVSNIRQYEERELRYRNRIGLWSLDCLELNVSCMDIFVVIPGRNKRERRREWSLTISVIASTIS